MADTIKDFLIRIAYHTDQSSQRQSIAGTAAVDKSIADLQKSLVASSKALADLGKALTAVSGDPAKKYREESEKVEKQQQKLLSTTKELTKFAIGTATTFAAGVRQVAREYEQLYFIAQRTGAAAENISSLQFGFRQVGLSADQAVEGLTNFTRILRDQPALGKNIRDHLITTEDMEFVKKTFGDGFKGVEAEYEALLHHIYSIHDPYARKAMADFAQQDIDVVVQAERNVVERGQAEKDHQARIHRFGLDMDRLKDQAHEFGNAWRDLWDNIYLGSAKGAQEALPGFTSLAKALNEVGDKIAEFDKLHPGAAMLEGLAAAAAGWFGLARAIGLVSAGLSSILTLLGGVGAAVAAGVALKDMIPTTDNKTWLDEARKNKASQAPNLDLLFGGIGREGAAGPASGEPHFQGGGIVHIGAHEGEAVLPAALTSLLMRAAGRSDELVVLRDILEGLRGWWAGSTAYRPVVIPRQDLVFPDEKMGDFEQGPRRHGDPFGLSGGRTGSGGAVGKIYPGAGPAGANAANFVGYLANKLGVERAHAEGMVTNLMAESSGDPRARNATGHMGLFQWDRSRWAAYLRSVPADKVFDPYSQLHYAVEEQRKRNPSWFGSKMSGEQATNTFDRSYFDESGKKHLGFELSGDPEGARLGRYRQVHEASKNVTINQTNNVHVAHGDPLGGAAVGRHYMGAHRRMSEDLVRAFKTTLG